MKSEHVAVIKIRACPVCGAINQVRYRFNELIVDGACIFCGSMVRWKRKGSVTGSDLRISNNEELELVPLDQFNQVSGLQ